MNLLTDPLTRGYARVTGLFYIIIAVAGYGYKHQKEHYIMLFKKNLIRIFKH